MQRVVIVVLALVAIGLVGFVGYSAVTKAQKQQRSTAPAAPPAPVEPPADAQFVPDEVGAEGVMAGVASARKDADRQAAEAMWQGVWVPNEGWTGEVVDVTNERSGIAVRLSVTSSRVMGGSFFVIAVIAENEQGVRKGDGAVVQGRISRVEALPGGPIPLYRIVLEPAKVLSIQRRQ